MKEKHRRRIIKRQMVPRIVLFLCLCGMSKNLTLLAWKNRFIEQPYNIILASVILTTNVLPTSVQRLYYLFDSQCRPSHVIYEEEQCNQCQLEHTIIIIYIAYHLLQWCSICRDVASYEILCTIRVIIIFRASGEEDAQCTTMLNCAPHSTHRLQGKEIRE